MGVRGGDAKGVLGQRFSLALFAVAAEEEEEEGEGEENVEERS